MPALKRANMYPWFDYIIMNRSGALNTGCQRWNWNEIISTLPCSG